MDNGPTQPNGIKSTKNRNQRQIRDWRLVIVAMAAAFFVAAASVPGVSVIVEYLSG